MMASPPATNPFTSAALKSEIGSDPTAMGLVALANKGQDQAVADLLNSLAAAGAGPVYRNDVKIGDIVGAIVSTDYVLLTANLAAAVQRTGSRAEVLWGAGIVVTASQCGGAR
jgi:hypothetical protein